jgi:hypothetical protein
MTITVRFRRPGGGVEQLQASQERPSSVELFHFWTCLHLLLSGLHDHRRELEMEHVVDVFMLLYDFRAFCLKHLLRVRHILSRQHQDENSCVGNLVLIVRL